MGRRNKWVACLVVVLLGVIATANVEAQEPTEKSPEQDPERTQLIQKLEKYLTGTRWKGQFTITGKPLSDLTEEYYEITKAKNVEADLWMLSVRIKHGGKDRTMDLPPIEVKWAGGTPVITVDQVSIPGMGTFDARVVIRKSKYAGTWSHNAVGGHLFGTIERLTDKEPGDKKSDQKSSAKGSGANSK